MEKVTMTVKEMAQVLGISAPKAYDLTHIEGFPAIHVGRKIVIPIESFHRWLKKAAGDTEETE